MISLTTIMPVYNMREYIEKTVSEWQNQTLNHKQLICIDDCSNDGTAEVLKNCASKYGNIKIITLEKNAGAGPARNRGILEAQGEYISFLDADDRYIEEDSLERLYEAARRDDCDICGGMLSDLLDNKVLPYDRFRNLEFEENDYIDLSYGSFQDDYYYQGFIYKSKYIKENGFEFPDLRRNQDPPFFVKTMFYANRIRVVNTEYYLHLIGHKSVCHNPRSICDSFKGFLMNIEFADQNGLDILLQKSAYRINRTFLYLWRGILNDECQEFWDMAFEAENILRKHNIKVDILGYYPYLHKRNDGFDEYMTMVKLDNAFFHDKRIIIYGAGSNGIRIYGYIKEKKLCEVTGWIDKNKSGEVIEDRVISDISILNNCDYDYVLISPSNRHISEEIKQELRNTGVDEKRIVEWINL